EYYESSYKGDISSIFRKNDNQQYSFQQRNIYSPYGMVWHKTTKNLPLYQQTLQEFDGERTDPATGWQFLGNGNRTYNPAQRYFLSEDPEGDGYTFGSNNPIMNTDPSGNSPKWLGDIFKWVGYVSTMGLSALHQRWANITAAVIQAGCTVATLGAAAAGAGPAALVGVVSGTTAIGSIPVVAASIPANKGLNIAGNIIGIAEMAVLIAAGVSGLLPFAVASESEEIPICEIPKMLPSGAKNLEECGENILATASGSSASISVQSTLIHPPFNPQTAEELFQESSCSFYDKASKTLKLNSLENVINTWVLLRNSPFHENINCDTGCILLSYQMNGEDLYIKNLDRFLSVRKEYTDYSGSISKEHPYIKALSDILNYARKKKLHFGHIGNYGARTLRSIFGYNKSVLVQGYNHMAILEDTGRTNKKLWKVYQFYTDSNNLSIEMKTTRGLATEVFINPSAFSEKLSFIGYMIIR
ncbi:MAG: RHS repeat-associated core domain-containing protein, partial [Endozoicomonadaceae bacterium]|nr:RHS repeat-associated core domain-containing protein [Endozoicomonadaceae bacterium]